MTSIGPVVFMVVAIAGLAFGEDAAGGAVSEQLSELMGKDTAEFSAASTAPAVPRHYGY